MLRRTLLNHSLSMGVFHTYPLGLEKTSLLLPPMCTCACTHVCMHVPGCACMYVCAFMLGAMAP